MRALYSINPKPTKCRWWVLQSNQQQTKGKLMNLEQFKAHVIATREASKAEALSVLSATITENQTRKEN
jgi:hypothetical protein